MTIEIDRRALLAGLGGAALLPGAARAQAFPSKPIHIFHGYGPASNPDTIARLIGPGLSEILGQQIVVEPKPGAAERIAAQYVAKQPPDGYTLYLMTGGANVISATDPKAPFDILKDFTFISTITLFPFGIFVSGNSPYKTMADLIADAKAKPGKLNYAHSGTGNTLHLGFELLKGKAGFEMEPIAYKSAELVLDTASGRVDASIATMTNMAGVMQNNQVRALGVTSAEPYDLYPNTPPVAQTVPGYEVVSWLGLAGPAGMPADVTDKLSKATIEVLKRPDVKQRLEKMGNVARGSTPEAFRARVAADNAKWKPLAKFVTQK